MIAVAPAGRAKSNVMAAGGCETIEPFPQRKVIAMYPQPVAPPNPVGVAYTGPGAARWLYGFLLFQFVCQASLVAPLGPLRIGFRVATFASSLLMLVLLPRYGPTLPNSSWVWLVIGLTGLGALHPDVNSRLAAVAQLGLTVAIWAPVFWATRFRLTAQHFRTAMLLLWGFQTLSAVVGVLQVMYPDQFSPDPEFVKAQSGEMAEGLKIELANGERVWRPFGLTDTPGGAAGAGMFAVLAGLVLVSYERRLLLRLAGAGGAVIGMFCLYVCQVRTGIVLTGIGLIVSLLLAVSRGRLVQAAWIGGGAAAAVASGFVWATTVGGDAVTARLETLVADRADQVYYSSRGRFLEHTIDLITEYPVGAGAGRWGMMTAYFGDPMNLESPSLWVEIQPTAWLYDGGVFLLLAGYVAVLVGGWASLRAMLWVKDPVVAGWGGLIVAMNIATLANTFSYAIFASQTGMMCWVFTGVLYARAFPCAPNRFAPGRPIA
ncbi:hypothetical protein GobsT_20470 [Gemmata obscuriglobus]|uniref:O-antigen ligase domain-containing protein n=1 Tax=Gemmata obscuriglobus TaxID=114 RepID=A0A2Z3H1K2_9BACT|nr:hypothetical protein [Gemmata obscuriglobus]AWM39608.1 hypothetical protein C1280_23155 [Gemmata obscuriglobus]QEG27293.1 hypothetical protein GobsT_20470 [Gemmata obscuriglobus]VTS04101.1 Uncharacterized protein OS=Corallococcus coralloides (strain ATCC 25202 / DSM 2259 / NBRC 100086 / M2) GN=COCOR_00977 PE=4 SV=1: O-antigen_lig [Gemmata obscuriglobus UQM 2246]